MSKIETWFYREIHNLGNRNNMLLRYAFVLLNSNKTLVEISTIIKKFNKTLDEPLNEPEIDNTILRTIAKKLTNLTL